MSDKGKPVTVAIILCGGRGSRISADKTKQKIEICGRSILGRTLLAFDKCKSVNEIVLVYREGEEQFCESEAEGIAKPVHYCVGGKTRAASARRGFMCAMEHGCDFVAIHDAARCLITPADIDAVVSVAYKSGAASAAKRVTDTVKLTENGVIVSTIARDSLVTVETPQVFSRELYQRALEHDADEETITDDNCRIERIGGTIVPVFTSDENIKITTPRDIALCEYILNLREKKQ